MTTRIKKSLTQVPASLFEATSFLVSVGLKQRAINIAKRDAKVKIEAINAELKKVVEGHTIERDTFFNALFAFASARKEELTKVLRSQKTSAGTFGWRWTTPYVELSTGKSDEDIIATLKSEGLAKYVRVIEEIDREALLRDRPLVKGISYVNRDEFFAKPKLAKVDGSAVELVKTEAVDV